MNWRGRIDAPEAIASTSARKPNTFLMGGQLETIFNPLQPQCLLWHVRPCSCASRVLLGGRPGHERAAFRFQLHCTMFHRIAT